MSYSNQLLLYSPGGSSLRKIYSELQYYNLTLQ